MQWVLSVGDLLDVRADVLVCSANVHLNLSGGVGGAFALKYGHAMQEALHGYLAGQGLHFVRRGSVIAMPPCGSPYRAVLHAVAIDAAYATSPEIITAVLAESLRLAASLDARSVALTAVGTGYGRLSLSQFAKALDPVIRQAFPPLERVVLGLRSRHDAEELEALVPALRAEFRQDASG